MKVIIFRKFDITKIKSIKLYLIFFIFVCFAIISYLIKYNITFVRNGDALTQHYPAFLYIGQYYRDAVKAILIEHKLPSTWDFKIGYGSDVITTLTYYGLTDWSTVIFAIFSNVENGAVLYTVMMMVRTFLAGLFFNLYCRRMSAHPIGSVIASFAYIFSPYMLSNVFNGHHFMALPVVYMPLLLLLIEEFINNKGNPVLYSIVVALAAMSSYYFFYMEMCFSVVYFMCRFPYRNKGIRGFLIIGAKIAAFSVLGIMIAAPVLFPIAIGLKNGTRTTVKGLIIPLLYSGKEYKEAIGNFIGSNSFSYYSYLGMSPCILVGIPALFTDKEKRWLQILFLIVTFSCLLPFAGYFMNGLSYVANRHVWIYTLIVSLIFAVELNNIFALEIKKKIFLVISVVIYILLLLVFPYSSKKEQVIATILLILTNIMVLIPLNPIVNSTIVSVMVLFGVGVHILSVFNERGGKYKFLSNEYIKSHYYKEFGEVFETLESDNSLWRLDWNYGARKPNSINIKKAAGSTYSYWSFQNPYLTDYLYENGVLTLSYEYNGIENRVFLQRALGCKYVVSNKQIDVEGYRMIDEEKSIYLNENYYPIVRSYNHSINEDKYLSSTYGQKQSLESKNCIVREPKILERFSSLVNIDLQRSVNYRIEEGVNSVRDNEIVITNTEKPIVIKLVDKMSEGDLFIELYGLQYEDDKKINGVRIYASNDGSHHSRYYYSRKYMYYTGFRNFNLNLKTKDNESEEIQLYFSEPGKYSVNSIVVENIPYSDFYSSYNEEQSELSPVLNDKGFEIYTQFDDEKILYFSVPYSSGWKAFVDGEAVDTFRANIMGVGMLVPAGIHNVVLRYSTPYLSFGMWISIVGIIIISFITYKQKKREF